MDVVKGTPVTILDYSGAPYLDGTFEYFDPVSNIARVHIKYSTPLSLGDYFLFIPADRIRLKQTVDKPVSGPLLCRCGSEKIGDPGHSNWCDIVTGKRSA